jgi:serine/threonine protein kinase
MIGTTIGQYRIVGSLGRGATGIVYRAVDGMLEREVAIKVLNPHVAASDIMKRFRAEATILAKLSHPEIATIHELLQTDTDLLMVMEFVRGETLENLANRVGPLPPDVAARLIGGILSGLVHAHRSGVVHRDLKPANVMVTQVGGIKIMDFGIARVCGSEHMTIDGYVVGTPAYMPPEQVLAEEIDGRADLYAVGVILYRLLTGKLPLDADAPLAMMHKQIAETAPPLHVHREGLPEWCEPVVRRALAKAAADRFQTAEEFREVIGRATGQVPAINFALAIPVDGQSSIAVTSDGVDTVRLRPEQEASTKTLTIAGTVDRPPVTQRGILTLAKTAARTGRRTAWLGGVAVSIMFVVYLASNGLAIDPQPAEKSLASVADPPPRSEPLESAKAGTRSSSATQRRNVPIAARPDSTSSSSAASSVRFRVRIVRAPEGKARDQEAQLSLREDRLTVAADTAPQSPVFSAAYADISAIEHSQAAAWKPPQKLSKVIRVTDDVLDAIGIRDRHLISLHTNVVEDFIVLRADERIVDKLLKALKQRTGRDPERD